MTDNKKIERIPVSKISTNKKFNRDLYYEDFLLHPVNVPITQDDLNVLRLWQVEELVLSGNENHSDNMNMAILKKDRRQVKLDTHQIKQAQELYDRICNFVTSSYQIISKQVRFPLGEPLKTVKQFIQEIHSIIFSLLRFQEFQVTPEQGAIEIHVAQSFILTMALAYEVKMPQHKLLNLGLAAMFHEVGLMKFIDNSQQPNCHIQLEQLHSQKEHVRETINLLKAYNLPAEAIEGIAEHHECLDGSGYPNNLVDKQISNLGRYLSLVCSYISITTQIIEQGHLPHTAILAFLKTKVCHDADLIKVLVQLISLYPISSYVVLNNKTIGRVIRSNPKDPRKPIVEVLLNAHQKSVRPNMIIQTNEEISVERPISSKELAAIMKPLEEK